MWDKLRTLWDKIRGLFRPVIVRELAPVPPWITIERYSGKADGYWKIIDTVYYDPGNTVVYAYAEDAQGNPSTISRPVQTNGGITLLNLELKEGRAVATFQMTKDSNFDPKRAPGCGPYTLAMFGASDKIKGMGLPLLQHVELHVTFRWTKNAAPPPPPPPSGDYVTPAQLRAELDALASQLPLVVKQIIEAQWKK